MFFKDRSRYYYHYEAVALPSGSFVEECFYTKGKKKGCVNYPIKREITNKITRIVEIKFLAGYSEPVIAALVTAITKQPRALVDLIVGELYDQG